MSGHWHDRTLESRARRKGLPSIPRPSSSARSSTSLRFLAGSRSAPEEYRRSSPELIARDRGRRPDKRQEETGIPPLGRDAVCRKIRITSRIESSKAPPRWCMPWIRRCVAPPARPTSAFRDAYRYAARRLRAGVTDFEFPSGAFPPPFRSEPPLAAASGDGGSSATPNTWGRPASVAESSLCERDSAPEFDETQC